MTRSDLSRRAECALADFYDNIDIRTAAKEWQVPLPDVCTRKWELEAQSVETAKIVCRKTRTDFTGVDEHKRRTRYSSLASKSSQCTSTNSQPPKTQSLNPHSAAEQYLLEAVNAACPTQPRTFQGPQPYSLPSISHQNPHRSSPDLRTGRETDQGAEYLARTQGLKRPFQPENYTYSGTFPVPPEPPWYQSGSFPSKYHQPHPLHRRAQETHMSHIYTQKTFQGPPIYEQNAPQVSFHAYTSQSVHQYDQGPPPYFQGYHQGHYQVPRMNYHDQSSGAGVSGSHSDRLHVFQGPPRDFYGPSGYPVHVQPHPSHHHYPSHLVLGHTHGQTYSGPHSVHREPPTDHRVHESKPVKHAIPAPRPEPTITPAPKPAKSTKVISQVPPSPIVTLPPTLITSLPAQLEEQILQWCLAQAELGIVPEKEFLAQVATDMVRDRSIPGEPSFGEWVNLFLSRHPNLACHKTTPVSDPDVDISPSSTAMREYFEKLNSKQVSSIAPEHRYSMDQFGMALEEDGTSNIVVGQHENLPLSVKVASLECTTASGLSLFPSMVVFKGQEDHSSQFPSYISGDRLCATISGKNWFKDTLALRWLKQVFVPYIKRFVKERDSNTRLLVLSCHGSDLSWAFLSECLRANVLLLCLPRGSGRIASPADVGVSHLLRLAYSREMARYEKQVDNKCPVTVKHLLMGYFQARDCAFNAETILIGWKEATSLDTCLSRLEMIDRERPDPRAPDSQELEVVKERDSCLFGQKLVKRVTRASLLAGLVSSDDNTDSLEVIKDVSVGGVIDAAEEVSPDTVGSDNESEEE